MAEMSYFSKMRDKYRDPNFCSRLSQEELRKNTRKIIKDISYDNLTDLDYTYFKNSAVISALIAESSQAVASAEVISNALNFYLECGLKKGYIGYPADINALMAITANESSINQIKYNNWCVINSVFYTISNPNMPIENIKLELDKIKILDKRFINSL